MASQPGFFDLDDRYAALSKAGDPLERLKEVEVWTDSSQGSGNRS